MAELQPCPVVPRGCRFVVWVSVASRKPLGLFVKDGTSAPLVSAVVAIPLGRETLLYPQRQSR